MTRPLALARHTGHDAPAVLQIEARAYGPDSTSEQIEAIRSRICVLRDDIVLYREMPVQSPFHLDLFQEELGRLSKTLPAIALLIDLTEAKPPNARTRERLREIFRGLTNLRKVAVFTERNFVLNIAAKFVLNGLGLRSYTIHTTRDEALKALANAG
jgi:hypothetical protein